MALTAAAAANSIKRLTEIANYVYYYRGFFVRWNN